MLGDLLEEGIVVKQADDLYCRADTPEQLVNFTRVLAAPNRCNKMLYRVIPGCSSLLDPLEEAKGGMDSNDVVSWSDELVLAAFQRPQQVLQDTKTTHIPHPKDTLWIIYK